MVSGLAAPSSGDFRMKNHVGLLNEANVTSSATKSPCQSDVGQKKFQPADLVADFCFISGACPCVAPCGWGLLAQDAVQRFGWPTLGQSQKDRPLVDTPE